MNMLQDKFICLKKGFVAFLFKVLTSSYEVHRCIQITKQ